MNRIGSKAVLFVLTLAVLLLAPTSPSLAQRGQPVGIATQTHSASSFASADPHLTRISSEGESRLGTWVVVGALVGAAAAGGWAAIEMSKSESDDRMLAGPMLGYVVGIGAVIGGVGGAFAYLVSHSPHGRSEPLR